MSRVRGAARLLGSRKHVKVGAQIGFDNQLMTQQFFERPILNSPYAFPGRHWEIVDKQPTNCIIDSRRRADDYFSPVPEPKKRRASRAQGRLSLGDAAGLSSSEQEYNPTPIINEVRTYVETWRNLPNPDQWLVTPETARLLKHWRHHSFDERPPVLLPDRGGRDGDLADRGRAEARAARSPSSGHISREPTSRPTRSFSVWP